jgi:hypothetical protein
MPEEEGGFRGARGERRRRDILQTVAEVGYAATDAAPAAGARGRRVSGREEQNGEAGMAL